MKRAIALFLALVFVFGLIPVSALAAAGTLTISVDGKPLGTLENGDPVTIPEATPPEGFAFKEWSIEDGSTSGATDKLTGFDATKKGQQDCTVTGVADDASLVLILKATFKQTSFMIEGSSSVVVSVTPKGGTPTDNLPDKKLPYQAGEGDIIRFRVDKGNQTNTKLDVVSAVKKTDKTVVNIDQISDVAATETSQGYEIWQFTMPAANVSISAVYRYLIRVMGAKSVSGVSTDSRKSDTELWAYSTGDTTRTIEITPEDGKDADDILSWTSSPKVTFTPDATTPKTKATFAMPAKPLTIFVNYNVNHVLNAAGIDESVGVIKNGDNNVKEGVTVTVKPELDDGYTFVDWTVTDKDNNTLSDDDISISQRTEAGLIFTMPRFDVKIKANTTANKYNLYLDEIPATGSTPSTKGNNLVTVGATVTVEAAAITSQVCTGWEATKDDGSSIDLTALTGYNNSDPKTLTFKMPAYNIASLKPVYVNATYKLTTVDTFKVSKTVTGGSETNISTPNSFVKDVDVEYGAKVVVEAETNTDTKVFDRWEYTKAGISTAPTAEETLPTSETDTTVPKTIFAMPISGEESGGTMTVTAKYKYKVTLTATGGTAGTIGSTNKSTGYFAPGETVTITAGAAETSEKVFGGWDLTGSPTTVTLTNPNEAITTFTMPKGSVTVTASYAAPNTVTMEKGGTVCITGTSTSYSVLKVPAGKKLTATASETLDGKAFSKWSATGILALILTDEQKDSRVLSFTMPGSDVTLTPVYETGRTVTVTNGTVKGKSDTTGAKSGTFAFKKEVTITADAVAGKQFSHWSFTTTPVSGKATTIDIADTSSYTFAIDELIKSYSATAYYTPVYTLTLRNNTLENNGNAEKHIEMLRAENDETLRIEKFDITSENGETSITANVLADDVITIKTPETVKDQNGANVNFTGWVLISGKGTLADASSAETTFTVGTVDAVLAAQYGGNVLIFKDAERAAIKNAAGNVISPKTIIYTDWTYENVAVDTAISLTAKESADSEFKGWICEPADLHHSLSDDRKTINFNMPTGVVKVYPSYTHTLKITDAMYSLDNGSTWVRGEGTGKAIPVASGETVMIKPLDASMAAPGDGTYTFTSWSSNSSRVGYQSKTAQTSFTMPPEDVEIACNYQTYTLSVQRTVDHRQETFQLRPGQYITLDSGEATGGRQFEYWAASNGLLFTVNDTKYDETYTSRLLSQRITVQMPNGNASIVAWFSAFDNPYYWSTDAFIRIEGEPKRYYALLESFEPYSMKVVYYPGAGQPGNVVNPRDYIIQIVKAGTYDTSGVDANGMFIAEGAYDLLITMVVDNTPWAPTERVMKTEYTHLYCSAEKPEFVRTFTKPAKTVYYEGENVVKDGLDVQLLSVNHVTGTVRYSVQRELAESEYQLYPRCYVNMNSAGDSTGLKDGAKTKLPTVAEIENMIADGTPGVKLEDGKYYVQMWVYCLNSSLLDTNGDPTIMQYLINDEADKIWVEVRRPLASLQLAAEEGVNTRDIVSNDPSGTHPYVSWEIEMLPGMGERLLTISAPGSSLTDREIADAIEIDNSDSSVAYLVDTGISTPLKKKLVVKSAGVTLITIKARGSEAVKATCEVTVSSSDIKRMTSFDGLNKTAATLFVGNTLTLEPYNYAPAEANTACTWKVSFKDNDVPQNANYYVSVSEAGVVKVLKPTDRTVVVSATPIYWAGSSTAPTCECEITVKQIPVDNMTLYPVDKTMYRLSTAKLKATLYPEAASIKDIIWTSTDSSIVSVDNEGNMTAHKLGTATITATAASSIPEDGDMTRAVFESCKVTVVDSVLLTKLSLNKTNITLGIDDTIVLSPYYTPATATTQSVTWTSSDTAIATVDANGKVRGLADGAVLITATANDGSGLSATCVVTVSKIVASAVVLNKQTLALVEDDTETLVATVYPTNASNAKVNWTSSNENVATVDPDGVVTATGGGSAVITATAKDASTKYADCVVAVTPKIPVTSLTLNLGNYDMLLNDTTILKATVAPTNATYKLAWSSSNPAVASVDENGKVSALTTGDSVITCKAGDRTEAITVSVVTKTFSTGKVVNCTRRVNVRAKASGVSTVYGYAYLGDVYKVLDKSTNWYKIQYNAGTVAYIWSRYLSATETGAGYVSAGKVGSTTTDTTGTTGTTGTTVPVVTAKSLTITNCTYCVNVRSGAGTTFSRLGYAYLDEAFTYTGTQGDWYIITYNGANAYVSSQFVKVS